MKKRTLTTIFIGVSSFLPSMAITNYTNMQPLKLTMDSTTTMMLNKPDTTWNDINNNALPSGDKIRPYKFKDDLTLAGAPLFLAGIIAKSEKVSFRQNTQDKQHARTRLLTNFHSEIDNYTQFAPAILAAGLNFVGVEGRSDTWRFLASTAMSYGIMAAIVNPIKYSASEMRPDGSTRNSWPSGHTATAFVSATILHKEYGLTRSPWYSVGGYAIATATGVMRVLNNRHWVSDVLSGAGIGIFSTELAYGLSDVLFKGKHLKRNELTTTANIIEHPSFFSISMGVGLGNKDMTFSGQELSLNYNEKTESYDDVNLKFATSTVVGAEGAYFLNKYIGIGGRLRVKSTPVKGWEMLATRQNSDLTAMVENLSVGDFDKWLNKYEVSIESDHITELAADMGLYFNMPLSQRWALGSKLLVGRSIIQDLDIDGHASGTELRGVSITEDPATGLGQIDLQFGNPYDVTWDYLTVSGNNTFKCGTGLSITYAYKSNFSFKAFVDYDFTRKKYTMTMNQTELIMSALPTSYKEYEEYYKPTSSTIKRNMHSIVLGGSFCVSF